MDQESNQGGMQEKDPFKSVILGAIFSVVISYIPVLNIICCLPWLFGSMLSVFHYTRVYHVTLPNSDGAKLGAMTGALGGLITYTLGVVVIAFFDYDSTTAVLDLLQIFFSEGHEMVEIIKESLEQLPEDQIDPLSPTNMILGIFFTEVISISLGALGGALGAALFVKN